ncbi:MAG: hypothetical protein A3F54_04760 [Candidatus Kerfeldbacteria bacterium RIFCSPHIGHO2_12_FULL_48_17]|uniref:UDP-N-acetylglucosamine--N-acetylmuramyl-(pentapeptide) pyrophosphoryl-undecaprenol N-acetylglucosamine transferase n=1 Tax=Candidatus Kerfeldbacteria bacterium RIFCSPHIGHO2_12_FULL_48_17 TaxID=1798542 RepID=A0A1G2AY34_9BACT|nr:MAG: hypothetical protein A3F54_04760 [Candidatus Kerfeldbacteria bacterium RIFCSPHIGHO2_12_FULL_48_17]
MRFLLSGGGTGGPTSTLLSLIPELKRHYKRAEFLFVGDDAGITKSLVEQAGIPMETISAGKFRRYASAKNFTDVGQVFRGIGQAKKIIEKWKPDIIISAGSFVSVPMVIAGWMKSVPVLIHQQDAKAGLANKIMSPFAHSITTALEVSCAAFPPHKTHWTGNPARDTILHGDRRKAQEKFHLENDASTLLVVGGGTGAAGLNMLIEDAGEQLAEVCNIIHITGMGKKTVWRHERYHPIEFAEQDFGDILAASDVVVSRAGMAAATELAALKKPVIFVPMPDSHQEKNAQIFAEAEAGLVVQQAEGAQKLVKAVQKIVKNGKLQKALGQNLFRMLQPLASVRNIIAQIDTIVST